MHQYVALLDVPVARILAEDCRVMRVEIRSLWVIERRCRTSTLVSEVWATGLPMRGVNFESLYRPCLGVLEEAPRTVLG